MHCVLTIHFKINGGMLLVCQLLKSNDTLSNGNVGIKTFKERENKLIISFLISGFMSGPLLVHILSFEMSSVASTPVLSAFHEG